MFKVFQSNQILTSLLYWVIIPFFLIDDLIQKDHFKLKILSILLIFIQGFYVNYLIQKHKLYNTPNQFAGLMIVVLTLVIPEAIQFSLFTVGNFFSLFAVGMLLDTYRVGAEPKRFFNIGLIFGLGVFLYPPNLLIIFVLFAGLNLLRSFSVLERLQLLSGIFVDIFLAGVYYFFTDSLSQFPLLNWVRDLTIINFSVIDDIWKNLFLGVLLLFILASYWAYQRKKLMQIQRKIGVFYFWGLLSFLPALLDGTVTYPKWQFMVVPIGTLMGIRLSDLPSKASALIFWLIIAVGLTFNYFEMFIFDILK